ncbi:MAG: DedA family protein [Candidatus Pacebacteria bacterium]|nr:DedA family protein [Candidatus Paceibacterota bacterium]
MTEYLINLFTRIISSTGYFGIAFLMMLESMVAPIPSEAVMPFAGVLWFSGKMSFILIIFFSTLGSLIGSLISYYIGLYGGKPFVQKFGKYLLLNEHDLVITENFFGKFGDKTIFISRFIPVVRHLISIPAGTGKMNIYKFIFYTTIGAGLWNAILTYLGYYLGSRWTELRKYGEMIDFILIILIIIAVGFYIYKKRKKMSMEAVNKKLPE